MRTSSQRRAEAILEAIEAVAEEPSRARYGALCHRLGPMIMQHGLLQTLAFLETRGTPGKRLANDVWSRIRAEHGGIVRGKRALFELDAVAYVVVSDEALQCAVWFHRYAESVLGVVPGGDADEG